VEGLKKKGGGVPVLKVFFSRPAIFSFSDRFFASPVPAKKKPKHKGWGGALKRRGAVFFEGKGGGNPPGGPEKRGAPQGGGGGGGESGLFGECPKKRQSDQKPRGGQNLLLPHFSGAWLGGGFVGRKKKRYLGQGGGGMGARLFFAPPAAGGGGLIGVWPVDSGMYLTPIFCPGAGSGHPRHPFFRGGRPGGAGGPPPFARGRVGGGGEGEFWPGWQGGGPRGAPRSEGAENFGRKKRGPGATGGPGLLKRCGGKGQAISM